jgi:uncharacterized protein YjiS (DUF1127 family)
MKTVASQSVSKSSLPAVLEAVVTPVDAGITRLVDQLLTWHQRVQDRRALGQLDAHMLHDIGLSRADVESEASKPFWQS